MKAFSHLAYLTLFTLTVQIVIVVNAGTIITADTKPAQCVITTDDKIQVIKDVGSVWHTNNSCVRHSCELDEDGNPHEKLHEETCVVNCKNEYEYRPDPSKCCGTCVKTKCLHDSKLYEVGDSWHTECTILECRLHNGEAMISAYTKTCPPVPTNCPQSDLYRDNCCTYCRQGVDADRKSIDSGLYPNDKDIQDKEFYKHHPCVRDCTVGAKPMACKYTFVVEWYETLSNACFDCPSNMTDCRRPHCITGDGVRRSITVVNRMMPGPSIEVCLNDTIMVDVKNHLLGESTTIHWHGLHQRDTPYMDGVPHVSQCPIQPHTTFRYTFAAVNPGTHFWHSHTGMQRGDGCFGPMIIRQPREIDPHGKAYDFDLPEHKLLIQDWTHQPGVSMYASHYHSVGDNKPPNILVNGRGRYYPDIFKQQATIPKQSLPVESTPRPTEAYATLTMEDDTTSPEFENIDIETTTLPEDVNLFQSDVKENMKMELPLLRAKRSKDINLEQIPLEVFIVAEGFKYRFRSINAEFLNCPVALSVDNHTLTVINSDGFDVEAINVTSVVTYAGERFDFIIHANQPVGNYWIRLKGLMDCDARFTSAFQVAILHYQGAERNEPEGVPHYDFQPGGIELNSLNMGPGYSGFVTINELKSLEGGSHPAIEEDRSILKKEADYKFFVYYDFYPKDNPDFHPAGLYGFNEVTNGNPVLTPQLNHISMTMPSLPLMPARDKIDDSMFCNETTFQQQGIDCRKDFCKCHHVLQVPLDAVVELILVDEGIAYDANHPFHLHGNAFRVIGLDRVGKNVTIEQIKEMDRLGQLHRNFNRPPVKDTVTVPDGGYTIIRFKADNPGYWLLHCHIEFHAEVGMALVIKVGEHNQMVPVPKNFPQCSDYIPDMEDDDVFVTSDSTGHNAASSVINRLTIWSLLSGVALSLRSYLT
ncbi:uncharacterized protein LOC129938892 [Eupeodes corollae]|uniref:uncharacterized protein LOC129938892 n=1 Tax=Eupeodes corollae TaxID=290404 RepID=UPI002491CF47|nr:uncharacterized protein LOC129938892 [Eupeodes corollae]